MEKFKILMKNNTGRNSYSIVVLVGYSFSIFRNIVSNTGGNFYCYFWNNCNI